MEAVRKIINIVSILSLFAFTGCATPYQIYKGQKLSSDKVAVVKGNFNPFPGASSVRISSVNGEQLSPHQTSIEVLPGAHIFGVQYWLNLAGGLMADGQVTVYSQAGKTYQIDSKNDGNTVTFSVVEESFK